jgi:phytoene synthase
MSEAIVPPPHVVQYCRAITRRRARNFYYGLKLLPEPRRTALYAMYAWMRMADDLVDNGALSTDEKHEKLIEFREATDLALVGSPPNGNPLWEGVAFVAKRFDLKPENLHAMLDGQLDDVRDRKFDTFESLQQYCYQVASTVGLVCIEIWGYTDPAARNLAIDRGIAFQLTNILRDLREDCDNGRVYLPQDEFVRIMKRRLILMA